MRLFRFLARLSGPSLALAMMAGAFSGACNAALLAWITRAIAQQPSAVGIFIGLIALKLATGFAARQLLARVAQRVLSLLRSDLGRRIAEAPLADIERAGTSRLLTALTDDIGAIGSALSALPALVTNVTVIIACSVYLGWLSPRAFLLVLAIVGAGVWIYRRLASHAMVALTAARREQERLFSHFRALTDGIVELQRHRGRREAFFADGLGRASEALERENITATSRFALAHLWSQSVVYLALVTVVFGGTRLDALSQPALTGFVLTVLYLAGPLAAVIQTVPALGRADIALDRVEAIGLSLEPRPEAMPTESPFSPGWRTIELDRVLHTYRSEDDTFTLGPITLRIQRGEILFVTGGNGSGKSTLGKLIAGLYSPASGSILVDGVAVTAATLPHYRELSSSVLSHFFLFDQLFGLTGNDTLTEARGLLIRLGLQHKVTIEDDRLSTTALSQGQRRRLALMQAALEGRALYVLDEWAAEQDAGFKDVFYLELLPELRAAGHTVIVISHDDRYFHVADRLVRLEEGLLTEGIPPQGPTARTALHPTHPALLSEVTVPHG